MLAILNKELRSYFYSATAYVFMGIFLLLAGLFFVMTNILGTQPNTYYTGVLSTLVFVFLLLSPVLTMKIVSEETKTKTDQLLYTSPQTITTIIVAKYLAAVILFLITLLITVLFPLILSLFGKVAALEILTAYIGFFLLGICLIAIGIFVSSLTDNQVVSAVGTFGISLCIWLLDMIQQGLPTTRVSGIIFALIIVAILVSILYSSTKNIIVSFITAIVGLGTIATIYLYKKELFEGFIVKFFSWFSLLARNTQFSMGILSLDSIIYYISFSFIFVFLTIRMIEKRRWS